jgi:hypothetical protein
MAPNLASGTDLDMTSGFAKAKAKATATASDLAMMKAIVIMKIEITDKNIYPILLVTANAVSIAKEPPTTVTTTATAKVRDTDTYSVAATEKVLAATSASGKNPLDTVAATANVPAMATA